MSNTRFLPAPDVFKSTDPRSCVGRRVRVLYPQIQVREGVLRRVWPGEGEHVTCVVGFENAHDIEFDARWLEIEE